MKAAPHKGCGFLHLRGRFSPVPAAQICPAARLGTAQREATTLKRTRHKSSRAAKASGLRSSGYRAHERCHSLKHARFRNMERQVILSIQTVISSLCHRPASPARCKSERASLFEAHMIAPFAMLLILGMKLPTPPVKVPSTWPYKDSHGPTK